MSGEVAGVMGDKMTIRAMILAGLLFVVSCASPAPAVQPVEGSGEDSAAVRAMEAGVRGRGAQSELGGEQVGDEEVLREQADRVSERDLEVFSAGVRAVAAAEAQLIEEGKDLETLKRGASSPAEVRRAEQQVLEAMRAALEGEGLELERFLIMGQFVRQNPFLIQRLRGHLEDEEIARFYGVEVQSSQEQ